MWVLEQGNDKNLVEIPKPITDHEFKYNWQKEGLKSTEYVTSEFMAKVAGIAKALQIDPDDLMAVMAFKSWLSPKTVNSVGATGLIQIMPEVAPELGTTKELARMSAIEQLDFAYGYLLSKSDRKEMKKLGDIYMAVLWPSAIGENDNYVLWDNVSKFPGTYRRNKGLDNNDDGMITKKEATEKVLERRSEYD